MSKAFTINKPHDAPLIEIDQDIIEQEIRMPVCDIEVLMEEGHYSRFFVSVRMKNGRPVVELATNRSDGKSTVRTVTGVKRKQD